MTRRRVRSGRTGRAGLAAPGALVAAVSTGVLSLAAPVAAQSPAEFYAGKQVTLTVGFNPGGGFDAYARTVARHMGRHIPGNPGMVVRNQPGAGGIIAANALYNTAPKDGTELGLLPDTTATDALLGTVKTQFDAHRFTWLGSASRSIAVCVAWATAPVKTAQDLMQNELVVGTAGTSAGTYPLAMKNVLGAKFKLVGGYAGTSGLMLALERGEIQGMCGQVYDAIKTQRRVWLEKGLVRTIVQLGLKKVPELGDVPWAMDLLKSDDDRKVLSLIVGSTIMGRPFAAPPGIPEERKETLRKAFMATMTDPQFLADAERTKIDVSPISGEEIERFVTEAYATPKAIIARAKEVLTVK